MKTELTLKPIILKSCDHDTSACFVSYFEFKKSGKKIKYSIMVNVDNISERNNTLTLGNFASHI